MDRIFGPYSCDFCHRPSPLGWLYKCSQDSIDKYEHQLALMKTVKTVAENPIERRPHLVNDNLDVLKDDLLALGFSRSIITQVDAGVYTIDQIEKLMAQRQHLCEVIENTSPTPPITPAKQTSIREPLSLPFPPKNEQKLPWTYKPCMAKFCQRCRPYMMDRCWTSFDAVFANEIRPLTITDTNILPIKSPSIARTLGDAGNTFIDPDSPESEISRFFASGPSQEITPTSAATSDSFPYSECSSSEDDSGNEEWEDEFDSAHCTNEDGNTLIYSLSRHAISTPDHFLQRTIRRVSGSIADSSPRSTSSGSSVSLPTPTTARTSPTQPNFIDEEGQEMSKIDKLDESPNSARSSTRSSVADEHEFNLAQCFRESDKDATPAHTRPRLSNFGMVSVSEMSRSSSMDSLGYLGCEMEVDGGVALTEEAIRTHTPDLVNQDY